MGFDVKKQLFARSERVKGIDFHPTEQWILTTLYSGHVYIWSYETQAIIKTFELADVPVRAGRFIARKNWIVCGSDDFQVRVYNYNTSEKITSFEAHPDYIRAIIVHPTQPFVLTASDDMTIKLWDWDKGWECVTVFEGHSHYVMGLAINPKDTNTFASACLDRTVKVWSFGSKQANYTIEAHETKGVNHVDYYPHADKPYLLTTSDDQTIKVWDYTTKSPKYTIKGEEGHTSNVSFACYHPTLPIIISGSEDGFVKIWNANTYKRETEFNYGLERAWCVSYQPGRQGIAVGYDDGAMVLKIGREEPAISMDNSGKLTWARNHDLFQAVIKRSDAAVKDGSPLNLTSKEFNPSGDLKYIETVSHSPNGRFVAVCGDGQFAVTLPSKWEAHSYGTALDFVWGVNTKTNERAIWYWVKEPTRGSPGVDRIEIYRNFKKNEEMITLDPGFTASGLSGGTLLGVKSKNSVSFFDWKSLQLVVELEEENIENVYWSESGELVTIACEKAYVILRFSREPNATLREVTRIYETVRSGRWVGDCFIYTDSTHRLNYLVGNHAETISHFDRPMYLLGYLPREGKAYVTDRDLNVVSYSLSLHVVEYQTLVLRGDMESAAELLDDMSEEQKNKIARFLEGQGFKEMALELATDIDHRFDLALALNNLPVALAIARETDVESRWKTVGDSALTAWDLALAEECFTHARDLGSLLLLQVATSNADGLRKLTGQAEAAGLHNVAFSCLWHLGDLESCIDLLIRTNRVAEAVLFAQTYKPSRCKEIVSLWKSGLEKGGKGKVSRMLGAPPQDGEGDADLFPEWEEYLRLEQQGKTGVLVDVADGVDSTEEIHADDTDAVEAAA